MLPFALKAVWFALCALGTVTSWFVLWFLGKATNTYWLPILYCVGLTILEGIFCLGMIYHMYPYPMPRSFCLAQIFTISFSALLLTGVCIIVILAVFTTVIWPSSFNASPQSALRWKWGYLMPLIVIPVAFASAQLALVIKYDAYSPSDNIHCDVTGPHIWLALLGYAGMPALESLPCFVISLIVICRLRTMYRSHQQTGQSQTHSAATTERRPTSSIYSTSHVYRLPLDFDLKAPNLTPPSPAVMSTHSSVFAKVGRAPPSPQFRPAVSPPPPSLRYSRRSNSLSQSPLRYNSQSPSPEWGPGSSQGVSYSPWSGVESFELQPKSAMDAMDGISVFDAYDGTAALPHHWLGAGALVSVPHAEMVRGDWNQEEEDGEETDDDDIDIKQEPIGGNWDEFSQHQARPDAQASFMSLTWRLVLFFIFFFLVQILLTLSTIIDVSRGSHMLTPFGTQHVALLLAAWGPSVAFAHAPGIRKRLVGFFWRSRITIE
ncbi:hypothetical protein FIBSPDRAFT_781167 [Athelia psychrophila]|uniref:Uncharacterized protein n=1 Tax=Athelia psychrophila TaxID=1759441 RepID=A0A166FRQ5_9AGAM|nr:hypothetical protein FIBSPDRAFT_793513 [Fibularhizoctonia sp. CBS 109695]KZP27063.1 hypothetical protein FIBSPDRAFT_781167 [Fibularhizoctonia sp. CBS 109695]